MRPRATHWELTQTTKTDISPKSRRKNPCKIQSRTPRAAFYLKGKTVGLPVGTVVYKLEQIFQFHL